MGLVLATITNDPGENFSATLFGTARLFYLWFLGTFPVAALLIIFTKIDEASAVMYGAGVYYGTILCGALVSDYVSASNTTCAVLGFVIASLICRIVYLKHVKE